MGAVVAPIDARGVVRAQPCNVGEPHGVPAHGGLPGPEDILLRIKA